MVNYEPSHDSVLALAECLEAADGTKKLLVKPDALQELPGILRQYYQGTGVCHGADQNTYAVAGNQIREVLEAAGFPVIDTALFPGEPRFHAACTHVQTLRRRFSVRLKVTMRKNTNENSKITVPLSF